MQCRAGETQTPTAKTKETRYKNMGNVELLQKLEQLKSIRTERESLEEQEAALIDEVKAEMLCRGVEEV